jgi:hypothetical protein
MNDDASREETATNRDESLGLGVYEDLVRLTFLCGRGLATEDLLGRFLATMRPSVPASGAWLYRDGQVLASSAAPTAMPPPAPPADLPILVPTVNADRLVSTWVLPGLMLTCRVDAPTRRHQRACDVIGLFARIIALAWQAENVAAGESWPDDYVAAKNRFKRSWLAELVRRHRGNLSAASRASGISRTYLYDNMHALGLLANEASAGSAQVRYERDLREVDPVPATPSAPHARIAEEDERPHVGVVPDMPMAPWAPPVPPAGAPAPAAEPTSPPA